MSFKISQEYFDNNLRGQENSYNLVDGFYERTIPQDQLTLEFHENGERKYCLLPGCVGVEMRRCITRAKEQNRFNHLAFEEAICYI